MRACFIYHPSLNRAHSQCRAFKPGHPPPTISVTISLIRLTYIFKVCQSGQGTCLTFCTFYKSLERPQLQPTVSSMPMVNMVVQEGEMGQTSPSCRVLSSLEVLASTRPPSGSSSTEVRSPGRRIVPHKQPDLPPQMEKFINSLVFYNHH